MDAGGIVLLHTHTLSQFVWIDIKSSKEETIMQKGRRSLPCKEPLGGFFHLKQSYDSYNNYVAMILCCKQWTVHSATLASSGLPPLSDKPAHNVSTWLKQWATHQHPSFLYMVGECYRTEREGSRKDRCCVCVRCVFVCVRVRDKPGETGSPGRLLHWRNFLLVRCVSAAKERRRGRKEGKFVLRVWKTF